MRRARRLARQLCVVALAAFAGACATPPARPPAAVRLDDGRFQLAARLQVRDGERSAAVGLDWQHTPGRDEWLFTGPLGQGLARLEAWPEGARLLLADGRQLRAASAAELAETALGVSAPFAELPRWVLGRRSAGAEVREQDALGRPRRVIDQGWSIDYLDYMDETPDALPRRLELSRGETRLRLFVDAWNP